MSLVLQSSGGGQITIQEPATASNFTQNLPAATGEVMVSGNMPAFSAYMTTTQTITYNTVTKLPFNAEEFDTASCFNTSTNRFTPTVAGYYQINGLMYVQAVSGRNYYISLSIYKNGTRDKSTIISLSMGTGGDFSLVTPALIYMNGTTDYLELYVYQVDYTASSTIDVNNNIAFTSFNGTLVRAA